MKEAIPATLQMPLVPLPGLETSFATTMSMFLPVPEAHPMPTQWVSCPPDKQPSTRFLAQQCHVIRF